MTSDINQWRATFEDTLKNQEKLRGLLDELEENNLPLHKEQRSDFFKLLARSIIGQDYEKECTLYLPDGSIMTIVNFGEFLRFLAYYELPIVDKKFLKRYGKVNFNEINIRHLWHELKFVIFGLYPEALALSMKISKEQTHLGVSEAGKV